jgi:hypothetical protein
MQFIAQPRNACYNFPIGRIGRQPPGGEEKEGKSLTRSAPLGHLTQALKREKIFYLDRL